MRVCGGWGLSSPLSFMCVCVQALCVRAYNRELGVCVRERETVFSDYITLIIG